MIGRLSMNRCVPDFEMADNDFSLPTFSSLTRPRKSSLPDDDVLELLWQNGQVVTQSQNQRSVHKSPPSKFEDQAAAAARGIRPSSQLEEPHDLFIQEDEMASWLNYPLVEDHNFCSDFLFPSMTAPLCANPQLELRPSATATPTVTLTPRPPIPPCRRTEAQSSVQFSRNKATVESEPSNSKVMVRESTVVDSCDTPSVGPESRASEMAKRRLVEVVNGGDVGCEIVCGGGGAVGGAAIGGDGAGEKEMMTCEMTVTSSPGDSSASAEPAALKPAADDRKRKGRAPDDTECLSEDIEYESADPKKQLWGSTSTKRSRATEVHNLSERRRRDRINEKMKALQELIPRCIKTDKASMLDEAIEYLKTLQLQVQMMSMGCGMMPVMFPGIQQYLPPPMGMGIGMGMGMGMEMGMNRPMMQFPNLLAGSNLPMQAGAAAAAAHLGPRFPLPAFAMPPVPGSDPSRVHATNNQRDPILNSVGTQSTNPLPSVSGFLDSYQQFLSSSQMQFHVTHPLQNQPSVQPNTSRPCTSRGPENLENHQSG